MRTQDGVENMLTMKSSIIWRDMKCGCGGLYPADDHESTNQMSCLTLT